jgi:hypothetical protein
MSLLNPLENKIQTKPMSKTKTDNMEGTVLSESKKPPHLSRKELLEISQNISLYYAPKISSNEKKLVLLSVDPEHLHVYWNLAEEQKRVFSSAKLNNDLSLQIYSEENRRGRVKTKQIANYKVKRSLLKQTINIPSSKTSKTYFATIAESNLEQNFGVVVTSNVINSFQIKDVFVEKNLTETSNDDDFINEKVFYGQIKPEPFHYLHTYFSGTGRQL